MRASRVRILLAACLCVVSSAASAQEVQFKGTTTGCFYVGTPCQPTATAVGEYLTFQQGSFNSFTNGGFLSFGSGPNSLGWFTLEQTPQSYTGAGFLLSIAFQLPTLTANPNAVYTAALYGTIKPHLQGSVIVDFDNTPQIFDFNGPDYQGSFGLTVDDAIVYPAAGATPIPGSLEATVSPEPATLALVATGLAGLVPVARRRRRKAR